MCLYCLHNVYLVFVGKPNLHNQPTSTFFCRNTRQVSFRWACSSFPVRWPKNVSVHVDRFCQHRYCIVRMCPTLSCRYLYLWAGGTRKYLLTADNEGIWRAGARNSSMHAGADDNKCALSRESTWARCDSGHQAHWILPQPCFTQSHYLQKVECPLRRIETAHFSFSVIGLLVDWLDLRHECQVPTKRTHIGCST